MDMETKELAPLKGQLSKLEHQAEAVTIGTPEDYASAVDLVARLKETGSEIKKKKEQITKPLNEALRNARELFAPIEEQFAHAEQIVKTKLLAYKRMKDEETLAEEVRIAARVEKGTMRLDTAEKKLDQVERISTTTRGAVGEVQVRKVKKVRITDEAKLPRQYLVPDQGAIRRDALSGIVISGVEVYEEEIIAAGRY